MASTIFAAKSAATAVTSASMAAAASSLSSSTTCSDAGVDLAAASCWSSSWLARAAASAAARAASASSFSRLHRPTHHGILSDFGARSASGLAVYFANCDCLIQCPEMSLMLSHPGCMHLKRICRHEASQNLRAPHTSRWLACAAGAQMPSKLTMR